MTCDDIFDALTSSSSCLDDPAVAGHLARCGRCRDLRDVLSPLLPMMQADSPGSVRTVSLQGTGSAEATRIAQEAAEHLKAVATRPAKPVTAGRGRFWSYAGSFLTGAVVSAVLLAFAGQSPSAADASQDCLWIQHSDQQLSAIQLVETCAACHFVKASIQ